MRYSLCIYFRSELVDYFNFNSISEKFKIEDDKLAFDRADIDKNGLDPMEWLSFRHPEHSSVMLKDMADEIVKALGTLLAFIFTVHVEFRHINKVQIIR